MNKKCQVFTPPQNVVELLDAAGYIENLYGKKIIENACGDGNILKGIVHRYIADGLKNGISIKEVKKGLEIDIYAFEIDLLHYNNCIENLDVLAKSFGIKRVRWNIYNADFLKHYFCDGFDFVVGNPPYITYKELDNDSREFLKETFESCKFGKFDYCYAFIEKSMDILNQSGILAYLIPSSIFKNVFANVLRERVLPFVAKIIDYTTENLFENVLTSSAILICDKGGTNSLIEYYDKKADVTRMIDRDTFSGKWLFGKPTSEQSHMKFGEYFNASISVATLYNKAFVIKKFIKTEDEIKVDTFCLEKAIVRKGVSPRSLNYGREEMLIFPYNYVNDKLYRYSKVEFESAFPATVKYLKKFQSELSERKSDKSTLWFEYGRTQALAHLNQPKLLISSVITKEVKVYDLEAKEIPYSGIYVTQKGHLPLSIAKKILQSSAFLAYVKNIGINANGTSMRITCVDVNNFMFCESDYQ